MDFLDSFGLSLSFKSADGAGELETVFPVPTIDSSLSSALLLVSESRIRLGLFIRLKKGERFGDKYHAIYLP